MLALLLQPEAARTAADDLAKAVEEAFPQHPDAELLLSGLKAYAGASPVTRASGKKSSITRRWVKNDRLNHAGYLGAFSSLRASAGADAHCRRRREHGDRHAAAQRNLFNRMIGRADRDQRLPRRLGDGDASATGPGRPVPSSAYSRLHRWDVTW